MTIEHNVITDPYIHEPKGIAAASSGKVYVSDGAGSGAWTTQGTKYITLVISNQVSGSGTQANQVPVPIAGTLVRVDWMNDSGTAGFSVTKNGTNITGLTGLSFSGAIGSDTSFSATTFVAGDLVGIEGSTALVTHGFVVITISHT